MTQKILFIGCSNLVNDHSEPNKEDSWKEIIFGADVQIKNLSWWGVGNQFINANLHDYLEDHTVDYVYVQFTGLARYDFVVHPEFDIPGGYKNSIKTYKNRFFCSGGKVGSWLGSDRTKEMFMPLYWQDGDYQHVADMSLQSVAGAINYLESTGIPYNWNFFYDITDPATPEEENYDGKIAEFPQMLNKNHWIDSDPHTYCSKHNGLQEDGCHFDNRVYRDWLGTIKEQISWN